jgi:hypothetical protein
MTPEKVLRYTDKVGDCLLWRGAKIWNGYGRVEIGLVAGKRARKLAHRVVFEAVHGAIPNGKFVCHTCDNRACVNPDHLWLGDNLANMRDCKAKGRHPHKENHGAAKLTQAQVDELRRDRGMGMSYLKLGAKYGISDAQAVRICQRKCWA